MRRFGDVLVAQSVGGQVRYPSFSRHPVDLRSPADVGPREFGAHAPVRCRRSEVTPSRRLVSRLALPGPHLAAVVVIVRTPTCDHAPDLGFVAGRRTVEAFSAASAHIARKDVDAAIALYRTALDTAPNHVDAQSYLAGWSRHLGRQADANDYVNQVRALDPARADRLGAMFATIDQKVSTPLTDALPALPEPGLGIVTLGYALHEDGSMDDILIDRLQQTKAAAQRWPTAPVVVTGGVEQSGRTEGESMKEWLVNNGVAADRIHDENFARSTVENASYGVEVLASLRATHALIISSASHIRRALTVFQLAAADTLGKDFAFAGSGSADKPLAELATATPDELLSIYRDAFSSIGMWSYRSAPLLRQ